MAITRVKEDSLVSSQIDQAEKDKLNDPKNKQPETKTVTETAPKKPKKPGFVATTIDELKKVEWPTLNYVLRWSVVIIIFGTIMAVSLGMFDHIFTGGVKFVDCSSPIGRNQALGDCSRELVDYIALRGN